MIVRIMYELTAMRTPSKLPFMSSLACPTCSLFPAAVSQRTPAIMITITAKIPIIVMPYRKKTSI